jgi:hypothetical protein
LNFLSHANVASGVNTVARTIAARALVLRWSAKPPSPKQRVWLRVIAWPRESWLRAEIRGLPARGTKP